MAAKTQILIAGAGAAGLTTGIALAQAGFSVALRGKPDTTRNGRTVALFEASLRLYRALGVWSELAPLACPMKTIRIVDDTGSFLRTPPLELHADEIGLDAFGANIENAVLVEGLARIARATPGLDMAEDFLAEYRFEPQSAFATAQSGETLEAQIIVGADGRNSPLRSAAGITTTEWSYPQVAVTALLAHSRPHWNESTEFHTRQGPCTFVPLPPDAVQRNRSSLVWLMRPQEAQRRMALDDTALALEIETQVHRLHGRVTMEGPRASFPIAGLRCASMVALRAALVADAAHYYPPIGAQGLNLGLRDVAQLVESLSRHGRDDAGSPRALASYKNARRLDVATRSIGVDALNRSLLLHSPLVDAARGLGVLAMTAIGPLRRALLREGVAPPLRLPELMHKRATTR